MSSIRPWLPAALVAAMLVSATGTYLLLGSHVSKIRERPKSPVAEPAPSPAAQLAGTLYLSQGGSIFSLSGGRFQQLTPAAGWTQVAVIPGGKGLLAVKRSFIYSDLYQLGLDGHVVSQLTHNAAPSHYSDIGANHWTFYPSVQASTNTIFVSYDSGKQFNYEVDLAIWQLPINGARTQWRQWTFPNNYTGGDVQPLPLSSGGLLYVKYDQDNNGVKASQLWLKATRFGEAKPLTTLAEDCSEPALSPDGGTLAMVCSYQQQRSDLVLASFDGTSLGPLRTAVSGQVVAEPAWAPNGSGIAFLSPALADQPFQLWWLPKVAYAPPAPSPSPSAEASAAPSPTPTPAPVKPIQVTSDLGFDATSPIAWSP